MAILDEIENLIKNIKEIVITGAGFLSDALRKDLNDRFKAIALELKNRSIDAQFDFIDYDHEFDFTDYDLESTGNALQTLLQIEEIEQEILQRSLSFLKKVLVSTDDSGVTFKDEGWTIDEYEQFLKMIIMHKKSGIALHISQADFIKGNPTITEIREIVEAQVLVVSHGLYTIVDSV